MADGGDKEKKGDKKFRSFTINGVSFRVDRRYYPVGVLGVGAYGTVCLAKDMKMKKEKVAIKKLEFTGNKWDAMALRGLREIHILRHLDHPNLLRIRDLMPPKSLGNFDCLYVVLPSMETNLRRIIKSSQPLENIDIQILMFQIIKAMRYFHALGLLHRDIKPSNILVNQDLHVKVCDFGLARGTTEGIESQESFTEYVVTRHYRAPEVMTSPTKYDTAIDVWGVGCVFAELLNRKVLFPGENYLSQLELILQKLGTPAQDDLDAVHPNAKRYIMGLGRLDGMDWEETFQGSDPLAIDLLKKMLTFNPAKRISMAGAMEHAWFRTMYEHPYFGDLKVLSEDTEVTAPVRFDWEKPKMKREDLIPVAMDAVYHFHPELKATGIPATDVEADALDADGGGGDASSPSSSASTSSSSSSSSSSSQMQTEATPAGAPAASSGGAAPMSTTTTSPPASEATAATGSLEVPGGKPGLFGKIKRRFSRGGGGEGGGK